MIFTWQVYDYGQRLKHYRQTRRISQLKLEIIAGMTPGALSRIESGATNPTKETLFNIAVALRLNKDEILDLFGIEEIIRVGDKFYGPKIELKN